MARKFGPFDTSQFYEVENRRLQRALAVSGTSATGFVRAGQGAVTAGTGAQLLVAAYPDGALIDGMYVENPATEAVTLTTNSGSTNPRFDRLVLRLDMTAKTIAPVQIVGTPAASPSVPLLVNTGTVVDLPLCRYQMPGSASAQNPTGIVDERWNLPTGNWTTLVSSLTSYDFGPSITNQYQDCPDLFGTFLVPAGRQCEVKLEAPALYVNGGFAYPRILANGGPIRTGVYSSGGASWVPLDLIGRFIGTGDLVTIRVQLNVSNQGAIRGVNAGPVELLYRLV